MFKKSIHYLDIQDNIRYVPEEGKIFLDERRMILYDTESLGLLRRDLIHSLGFERAKGFMFRFGWNRGVHDAKIVKKYKYESDQEWLVAGPRIHQMQGFAKIDVSLVEVDSATGSFFMEGTWEGSYEVEEYLKHFDNSHFPVCSISLKVSRISAGTRIGEGEAIRFTIPTGHDIELYHHIQYIGTNTGTKNPDSWPDDLKGMAPQRLDHSLLVGDDLESTTRFFMDVFDFQQSEKVLTVDGKTLIGSFLFRTNKAHDIAFVKGPNGKLHHIGFYLDEWSDIRRAADIMVKRGVMIDEGPTRHGITRGTTVYFFDPSGNRNEVFCGGYITYEDFPTITWTEDEIAKAIFYYRRELPERFVNALT